MAGIIRTIEELRKTVKVSAKMPFDTVEPFLRSARDLFLVRYLGRELVEVLEMETVPDRATELRDLVQLSLGPLAIWIGDAELSVRIGDSGMTVENIKDQFVAASETKIANVSESVERRGFQYLNMALHHIWNNLSNFPEWRESSSFQLYNSTYLRSPSEFQEKGGVNIEYNWLTFENLRPLMANVEEKFIVDLIGDDLDDELRNINRVLIPGTDVKFKLISLIKKFVACKTAELYTSQASRQNRSGSDAKEYKPIVRPAYVDTTDTGNFYAEQSAYYLDKVKQILIKYASELGVTTASGAVDFNSDERRMFFAG